MAGVFARSRTALALGALLAVAACGPHVGQINANPNKHYEEQIRVTARVSRRQIVSGEALLELADAKGRRIFAVVPESDAPHVGDWVRLKGVFVADRLVGDTIVYDVLVVETIKRARKPWQRPW